MARTWGFVKVATVVLAAACGGSEAVTPTPPPPPPPAAVATVDVSPASVSIVVSKSAQLTAAPKDASGNTLARSVSWSTSDPSRATVSSSGLVTALTLGNVSITATSEGRAGTATVTVIPPAVATVSLSLSSASALTGQTVQAIVTLQDETGASLSGRSVTWSVSDSTRATIVGDGRIRALAAGSVSVIATSEGKSASGALNITTAPADPASQSLLSTMLGTLPGYLANVLTQLEADAPRNPQLATWYSEKINLLRNPALPTTIASGSFHTVSGVRSRDGRWLPIVGIFSESRFRNESADLVGATELAVPLLERFINRPFPWSFVRIWQGFQIGSNGGGASLNMEDRITYEARTPVTRLPWEAIAVHEASHNFIGHESMTQFLEVYLYNMVRTQDVSLARWSYRRGHTGPASTNTGVLALIDIYQLIGHDAMGRAYSRIVPLNPPYGVALTAAMKQIFVDEAPATAKAEVASIADRIGF